MKVDLKKGERTSICTCGKSGSLPICDGTHKAMENVRPLRITPDEDATLEIDSLNYHG
ncbi:MAG: CDGSH iron-sulfur domain-containing protein [Nanoarchaeota archaeon]